MIRGEASTTIRQPASTVFSFIVDDFLTNYPRWSPEVLALRPLSHGVLRVGFMAEQTRVDQGWRSTSTLCVTAQVGADAEIDRLRLQLGDAPR